MERYHYIQPFAVAANTAYIQYHHLGIIPCLVSMVYAQNIMMNNSHLVNLGMTSNCVIAEVFNMTKESITIQTRAKVGLDPSGAAQTTGYYAVHVWG